MIFYELFKIILVDDVASIIQVEEFTLNGGKKGKYLKFLVAIIKDGLKKHIHKIIIISLLLVLLYYPFPL